MEPDGENRRTRIRDLRRSVACSSDAPGLSITIGRLGVHDTACRTNGKKTYSTPIFATLALEEPQIFRRWSFDRGLCDRLDYAGLAQYRETRSAAAMMARSAAAIGVVDLVDGAEQLAVGLYRG